MESTVVSRQRKLQCLPFDKHCNKHSENSICCRFEDIMDVWGGRNNSLHILSFYDYSIIEKIKKGGKETKAHVLRLKSNLLNNLLIEQ